MAFEKPTKLKPGDIVRVVGARGTSRIRAILTAMHGALLEKEIAGFRNWNLDELRLVKRDESYDNGRRKISAEHRAKLVASAKTRFGKTERRDR